MNAIDIRVENLQGEAIKALLQLHLDAMYQHSPPESVHALDLNALRHPSITCWTAWAYGELLGCGALKRLSPDHGELKFMRTADAHQGKGVARALLRHIESAAQAEDINRLSLETGGTAPFAAAHQLYVSEGFMNCGPFADYALDPFSVFMTKLLADPAPPR